MKKKLLLIVLSVFFMNIGYGQNKLWTKLSVDSIEKMNKMERGAMPEKFDIYSLDVDALKIRLLASPIESQNKVSNVIIGFPNSEGQIENFRIYEAPVMEKALSEKYRGITSYVGKGVENPTSSIRFSVTLFGLHVMSMSGNAGTYYIDTFSKDLKNYILYKRCDIKSSRAFSCLVEDDHESIASKNQLNVFSKSGDGLFRNYRMAMACTIEYAAFHVNAAGMGGGTIAQKKAAVLSAMVVTMTRVNGLYERDMSLRMTLIGNNDEIIFITSDEFSNSNANALINESQTVIDAAIGPNNYDIGHTVSTGGGGLAQLNSPCTSSKARGITGSPAPVGDPFDIDYVAHEVGHQFGATHTFNNSCGGNRSAATAVEPGSGNTIMGYAGICAPNVQNNSDAHFHTVSIAQMSSFVGGAGSCAFTVSNGNTAPVISAIPNYTIPKSTPFILKGNATDVNGDALTYCWEQTDNQISTQAPVATSTGGPNFKSLPPSVSSDRYMPNLQTVLSGLTSNTWEVVPSVARSMNFALTVRDNRTPNGGQTSRADMVVTTSGVAGPFAVTSPNTVVSWVAGTTQTVTWNVAGTTANNVNTPYVDIYMSSNGGSTFPLLLASKVPNDGSEIISVPNLVGTQNRIMVMGHNNIFYDVSNTNFTITAPTSSFAISYNGNVGEQNKSVCKGNNTSYSISYQALSGFSGNTNFSVTGNPTGTSVSFVPSSINANGNVVMNVTTTASAPNGVYTLLVTATSGTTTRTFNFYLEVVDGVFGAFTLSTPANGASVNSSNVNFTWQASTNASAYDIQISTDAAFSNIVNFGSSNTNSYSVANLPNTSTLYWRVRPKNISCSGNYSSSNSIVTNFCYSKSSVDVPVLISADGPQVVESTLTIPSNENVTISKVTVTLNISHTWINDLIVSLISPTGTEVQLFNRVCNPNTQSVNAVATFDDNGSAFVCNSGNPAVKGIVIPAQSLSAFNSQNSQGIWKLKVQDMFNEDGGSINSWSLNVCSAQSPLNINNNLIGNFVVYPNPNNGSFNIKMDQVYSDQVSVQVYDLRGRSIYQNSYSNNGVLDEVIHLNNVQSGVYMLMVSDGEHKSVKRIIIN